ncbi:hypothetical protein X801_06689, partial [Opisthorchis viverrini]
PLQKCTFDENHWIPSDRTHEHEEFCKLRKCGYTKNEIFNMLPTPASAGMGELRRHRTSEPMVSLDSLDLDAFSTSQQKKMRMVQYRLPEDGHRVETLALIRDSKRRSKSYRGIHTARRSYTEILREIIEQQTELLQEAYKRQYRTPRHLNVTIVRAWIGLVNDKKYQLRQRKTPFMNAVQTVFHLMPNNLKAHPDPLAQA